MARFARFVGRLVVFVTVLVLILGGYGYHLLDREVLSSLPDDLSSYRDFRPRTNCRVYAADGALIDEFYVERRIWVPLDELPPHVWQAFVTAEDRRFFRHRGVDFFGIARALYVNYRTGGTTQGASTLTQQLVKNLMVGKERSYERKLREAVLAFRLENELDKQEILELYLNYVALGSGNYGVEAAARDYFGLSAREIDPGQAALLAGLPPAPSRYSPRSNPETAKRRRNLVLRAMVDLEYLNADEAAEHLEDPVLVPRVEPPQREQVGTEYITHVRREIRRLFGDELPFDLGLHVYTPLDLELQQVAEQAVRDALHAHQDRQGRAGPVRNLPRDAWDGFLARADGLRRDPATQEPIAPVPGECFKALVPEGRDLGGLRAGPWTWALAAAERDLPVRATGGENGPRPLRQVVRAGDLLDVCLEEGGTLGLADRPWSEGAAVVLENATGRVRAMVGGYDVGLEGFVRATQARRQPGSSFKPYVYAAALLHGRTQLDTVVDGPLALAAGGGRTWSPKNYSGGYAGPVTLRRALAKSLNTVSVRLALELGADEVARVAREMGVRTPLRKDLTIALGSSEVTPLDQALGYATLARLGVSTDPVFVDALRDVDGKLLAEAGDRVVAGGEAVARLPGGPGVRVLPAGIAYETADMMREVVTGGTARRAWVKELDRAGKTGTTNDYVDAWFVGFTPDHTVVVWIGTDGTGSLGEKESGGRAALPAWITIVDALPKEPGRRLPVPDEAILVPWEGQVVGLTRGRVPRRVLSATDPGEGPLPAWGRRLRATAPATAGGGGPASATIPGPGREETR